MGLGLLIIPTLLGYLFLILCNYTRYDVSQDSGYHVFFKSALTGMSFLIFSDISTSLFSIPPINLDKISLSIPAEWMELIPSKDLNSLTLCLALIFTSILILNSFHGKEEAGIRTASDRGQLIRLLMMQSLKSQALVEISLESGKSYVGVPIDYKISYQGASDIGLVLIASGYRDKDTKTLLLNEDYIAVALRLSERHQSHYITELEQFRISVPISQVVSARPFDPVVYEMFQSMENNAA